MNIKYSKLRKAVETENEKMKSEQFWRIDNYSNKETLLKDLGHRLTRAKLKKAEASELPEIKNIFKQGIEKQYNTYLQADLQKIEEAENAPMLENIKISIEWKRNPTWGLNPTAEISAWTQDEKGNRKHFFATGKASGCGYDKESAAVFNAFNSVGAILKPLYAQKNKTPNKENDKIFGYGLGCSILPSFQGGVGLSVCKNIFDKIGYKCDCVVNAKTFSAYTITKAN